VTRIDFHYNLADKLHYTCRLARKILRAGQRAVFFHEDSATMAALDQQLWTFAPTDFVPHVLVSDALAASTPLLLACGTDVTGADPSFSASLAHHEILVHLGNAAPPSFSSFVRLIEIVSQDPQDRAQARERVKRYKDMGYPVQMHDMGAVA
jgi:DNA polymerase III subunit chi